jgi:phytoene dehydrogenase-like protein
MARVGLRALRPAASVALRRFRGEPAKALFAGNAAHTGLPLDRAPTAAVATVLMVAAHAVGWPFPRGGAGALSGALGSHFRSLGGTIETGASVRSLDELPEARAILLALTPQQVVAVAADRLPRGYAARLRTWSYGPAAFKMDWALDGPIPWSAEACRRAGTVHVGGTLEEIAGAEATIWRRDEPTSRPFVLVAQPTLFDPSRAPPGKHTAWAYCHVPVGSTTDMAPRIEAQIERFAPGFGRLVLARHARGPRELEAWDANLVWGDINGGTMSLRQSLARPVWSLTPWATPVRDLYLCSSSTPPGGGVHGMCGFHAARAALRRTFRR